MAQDPAQLQALLAQLGGPGGDIGPGGGDPTGGTFSPPGLPPIGAIPPPEQAPEESQDGADWLVEAINAVHQGMVEEQDPKQVSLLGAIINQLTTFQANQASAQKPSG